MTNQCLKKKHPFLETNLNFRNGKLSHLTMFYATGLWKLNPLDYNNSSPLMKLIYIIINNEVSKYQQYLAGGKI